MKIISSRSRILDGLRCPRAGWWLAGYEGVGLEPVRVAVPLATGGAVHAGLASLMEDLRDGQPLGIELAVAEAFDVYDESCAGRDFDIEVLAERSYVYTEQRALVEGLVRMAGLDILPVINRDYEVLEVEQEDKVDLTSRIEWHATPDALVKSRTDGHLYLISWKTCATWDEGRVDQARTDMQGVSEAWTLEQRLTKWHKLISESDQKYIEKTEYIGIPDWFVKHYLAGGVPEVRGTQMIYLVKGQRRQASADNVEDVTGGTQLVGVYKTASPLVYGYKQPNGGISDQFCASLKYVCDKPHAMRKSQWYPTGECPGDGRRHVRTGNWQSFPAWQSLGVRAWVEMIQDGQVEGARLSDSWVMPPVMFRRREEKAKFFRQLEHMEHARGRAVSSAEEAKGWAFAYNTQERWDGYDEELDIQFPQNGEKCYDWFGRACPCLELCHGASETRRDPIGSGLYQLKTQYVEKGGE